ncbi:MAG TPA: CotH kinase family protein, partial [Candidatus Dormibacteraeota bacterium]|nr:CotH kinase family protein [Candidatus Dormibacteraeota bacterium]
MGPTPIGYGTVAEAGRIVTPLPTSKLGGYLSVYLRHSFNVPDPELISQLSLALIVDDGAIVWINGVELGRINVVPGDAAFNATAIEAGEGRRLDVMTNATSLLVAGENILAVHLFNSDSDSSDIAVTASLVGLIDDQPPILTARNPPATATVRESVQVEVLFSEAVTNVDSADLLINGAPATTVTTVGPDHYLFRFPEPPAGVIHVDWSPNHGITDRAHLANPFVGRSWTYTFAPNAPPPDILISEFMASNRRTLRDEDGETSDWIEIRNLGSTAENLSGWFLTDKAKKPTMWKFPPGVLLPPNDFMIVFASAKNRTGNPLHTNFKLSASGGYLALVRPDERTVASEFAPKYPPQLQDISYGRNWDQPGVVGFSVEATPGAPNSAQGDGFASPVVFSRESSTFVDPFVIEMSAPPGSVIHYTTTTNLPTLASPVYAGPIRITATTVIRARAYAPGRLPGPPRTGHYIQLNTNAVNFTSDLPIAILDNFGGGPVPAKGEQYVCLMVFEPKANRRSSITNAPDLVTAGRFHRRGSSTLNSPKASWAFEAWDEFFHHKDVPLLGMPPESDWVMYAPNEYDLALIHNPLAYQLSREIGRQAPRTRFVEVLLKKDRGQLSPVNLPNFSPTSDYYGIYVFMEKIKIGEGRVNIDKLQEGDAKAPAVTGGYLWKIDRPDPGQLGFVGAGRTVRYVDPDEHAMQRPAREAQRQYIKDYFRDFGVALKGADFRDSERGYRKYIDMDSWIDHHILNVVMFNVDALHLSAYFHKPRNGRITMGPLWDFDRALGSTDGRDFNPTKFGRISSEWSADFFKDSWWKRMFTDPDFWQA